MDAAHPAALPPPIIMFQSLAHAHGVIHRVAQTTVELNHTLVGPADLEVDLRATGRSKQSLRLGHNHPRQPAALELGSNRQVIEPAAVPFVTGHYGGHNLAADRSDEEPLGVDLELAADVPVRIVPGTYQIALLPQGDDARLVFGAKASDFHQCAERFHSDRGIFYTDANPIRIAQGFSETAWSSRSEGANSVLVILRHSPRLTTRSNEQPHTSG